MRRCQQMCADRDGLGEDFKFARAEQEAEPDRLRVFSGLEAGIRADSLRHQFDKCRVGQYAADQQDVVGFYLRPCFDKIIAVSGNAVYQNHTPAVRQQGGGVGNRAFWQCVHILRRQAGKYGHYNDKCKFRLILAVCREAALSEKGGRNAFGFRHCQADRLWLECGTV